ncbi:hypothetical protein LZG74_16425 [Dyadobacter sp. CY327]|uniref:hypothetical protein n=1 Tax=Dyadobacter sp. CY327 TaxID=2907301 RepID=UPI001F3B304F|nr:hypothetical protein [Dyadobacter sp. CY327]MCE7071906.1 hypothetical protein [Dyadobacter sp. CY327]
MTILFVLQTAGGLIKNVFAQQKLDLGKPNDYYFSSQIFKIAEKKDFHLASFQFSFISDYKKALQYADSSGSQFGVLTKEDSSYFSKFKPVSAHTYIIERAKRERIIIFNEAHHNPQHRAFTLSLLQDLYDS